MVASVKEILHECSQEATSRSPAKTQQDKKAESSFNPQAYFKYVEDLKQGSNAEIGPKDYFEIASINFNSENLTVS